MIYRSLSQAFILLFLCIHLPMEAQLSLETVWASGELYAKRVPGFNFRADGASYTRMEDGSIVEYDLRTGEQQTVLVDGAEVEAAGYTIAGYSFSQDEKYILIYSNPRSIYRYSFTADYAIFENNNGNKKLTAIGQGPIQNPELSPDGKLVAYVQDNNLYVQNLEAGGVTQITQDGEYNKIINGVTDWVYEEEFAFVQAYQWSPDGKQIAYLKFNESEVPEFTMTGHHDQMYPVYNRFKYPKVGEKNSVVSLHVYTLGTPISREVVLPNREDDYIARIQWTQQAHELTATWLNRHQNKLKVYAIDTRDMSQEVLLEEDSPYYIDVQDEMHFTRDGKYLIWQSDRNGYEHIYLHNIATKKTSPLTTGDWDVAAIYGVDEEEGRIYFQSAEKSPMDRSVSYVSYPRPVIRHIADADGWNSAQFSGDFNYYVHTHSTANSAPSYTVRATADNRVIRVIEDNADYPALMKSYGAQPVEFLTVKNEDGTELNSWMIKPSNYRASQEYPLLLFVYGGPGSQTVFNRWSVRNYWYFQYLAQQGYMIASVDNRGTGARGREFKKMTYLQLGKYETLDQIAAATELGARPDVDEKRIGIFGWSYGGYMSSLCILKGAETFKAAVAVAPVTNWKWYDTIYTERYMRTEEENKSGYADNSPVYFADRLQGDYMIVHGMGDDNVHFQHTAEMVNALINANKDFTSYFYPNRNHGIYGGYTRLHLFRAITKFLNESIGTTEN